MYHDNVSFFCKEKTTEPLDKHSWIRGWLGWLRAGLILIVKASAVLIEFKATGETSFLHSELTNLTRNATNYIGWGPQPLTQHQDYINTISKEFLISITTITFDNDYSQADYFLRKYSRKR